MMKPCKGKQSVPVAFPESSSGPSAPSGKTRGDHPDSGRETGAVLVVAMIVSLLLALIGMYSAGMSSMGVRIASNYMLSARALYITQAGIEEARVRLPEMTQAGEPTPSWRAFLGTEPSATNLFHYDPSDADHSLVSSMQNTLEYTVEVRHKIELDHGSDLNGDGDKTDVVLWGDTNGDGTCELNTLVGKPVEIITSVGEVGGSSDKIEVEVFRGPLDLKYAVFGDQSVDTKNSGTIWKGAPNGPFVAAIGSNESIEIRNDASIYGDVDMGRNAGGAQGTFANHGGTIWGSGPNYIPRIDPDPLKLLIAGSQMDKEFTSSMTSNQNTTAATPAIAGTIMNIGNGGSMTLNSGDYYLTSIQLHNGATLNVDVSSGPVDIYLDGPLTTDNSGSINLLPSESPPGLFTVYCRAVDSTSSPSIDIKNGAAFRGVIYAPEANVSLHNGGDIHGMIWGRAVDIKNSGEVVFDPALKRKFMSPKFSMRSWKEER